MYAVQIKRFLRYFFFQVKHDGYISLAAYKVMIIKTDIFLINFVSESRENKNKNEQRDGIYLLSENYHFLENELVPSSNQNPINPTL